MRLVSSLLFLILLMGLSFLIVKIERVEAAGTIYIRADGSIDPPTVPIQRDGNVYTFTGNVYDSVVVERENITIDGANYTIQGNGAQQSIGISLARYTAIKNTYVRGFWFGISGFMTSYCTVTQNTITSNMVGIRLSYFSLHNLITYNHIVNNSNTGISLSLDADNNSISKNKIVNNDGYGIFIWSHSDYTLITENIIGSNECGIIISSECRDTSTYHNSFLWNNYQLYGLGSASSWDDGYPSGGNYWSDYNGTDYYQGAYQNETGSDDVGDTPYAIDVDSVDRYPLMKPYGVERDIAVISVTTGKTVIGQGYSQRISVEIGNYGAMSETFNVTAYADTAVIGTANAVTLEGGDSATFTFTLETTQFAKGKYLISASAIAVPDETATYDNTFTDGWVFIAMVGDITGPDGWPDGKVDVRDIAFIAVALGSVPGHSRWNSNADINGDSKVDIKDIATAVKNYGQTDP